MELLILSNRARPDPLVSVSDLTRATVEAMCDFCFVVFLCLYMFLCPFFLMCDLSVVLVLLCSVNVAHAHPGFQRIWHQGHRPLCRGFCGPYAGNPEERGAALAISQQGIVFMYIYIVYVYVFFCLHMVSSDLFFCSHMFLCSHVLLSYVHMVSVLCASTCEHR